MDFIATETNHALGWGLIALSLLGAIFTGVVACSKRIKHQILMAALSLLVYAVSLAGGVYFLNMEPRSERDQAVTTQIEDSYGLELSPGELESLKYPSDEPTESFEAFGSFEKTTLESDDSILKRELTLIWKDGKMLLAQSEDGENFVPLETKN